MNKCMVCGAGHGRRYRTCSPACTEIRWRDLCTQCGKRHGEGKVPSDRLGAFFCGPVCRDRAEERTKRSREQRGMWDVRADQARRVYHNRKGTNDETGAWARLADWEEDIDGGADDEDV